jgi:hypothetical protein
MSTGQIFIMQHSNRISSAGYSNISCPYQSPVGIEQIVAKPRNNYSVNITNMMHMLNFGVMLDKLYAGIS